MRLCLDLTPLEMIDRHGGIGRYTVHLLEELLRIPAAERDGIDILAMTSSLAPPVAGETALARTRALGRVVHTKLHRIRRRVPMSVLLRAARIDLFHSTEPAALPLAPGCPVIATSYDVIHLVEPRRTRGLGARFKLARERLLHRVRYARPAHVIAISATTKNDIVREIGIAPERITVVHLGVDTNDFSPAPADPEERERTRARHGLPERWLLCVSSDHYRKNHRRLFDAWCRVADRIPEGLVFVGRSLYAKSLQEISAEVRRRGIASRFLWLSDLDDDALPPLYRHATAAVAPSLYEGFGMTILEAMACGTPVVAARNGAYDEVGGDDAIYFDPRSVDEIAAALERVSGDAALRASLRARGLVRAKAATWQRMARETLAVYRRVLG